MEKLPTKKQINPHPGDLDGDYAVKNWLNKSIKEGASLFEENALHYAEDFSYMGHYAFNYYLQSAILYAQSKASIEDSDFINSFIGTLKFRYKYDKKVIKKSINRCLELLSVIVDEYPKYEVNKEIYGDLEGKAKKLIKKLNKYK
ncbi:MAG: hypothetical protein MK193_07860 [Lentisphaeria bacterium]|nr:hypothetical protein [Lentisphaeria bacterium]